MKVVCIRDENKPNEIPLSHWVKKDEVYTIIQVDKLNAQGGILGCKLEEIDLSAFAPYQYFSIDRFAPVENSDSQLEYDKEHLQKLDNVL